MQYHSGFLLIYPFTHKWEKGTVNNPNDPGGLTKDGVSFRFLQNLPIEYADIDGDKVITHQDLLSMPDERISDIMYQYFFLKAGLCRLNCKRTQSVIFDFGVNSGMSRSVKFLQENIGLKPDGVLGPVTASSLNATACKDDSDYFQAMSLLEDRERFLHSIVDEHPNMECFLAGWMNRCHALLEHIRKY